MDKDKRSDIRLLFFGDIIGKCGREGLTKYLPNIKAKFCPDLIIANGENAARGFGITEKICDELFSVGVNVITTGNHIWDQKPICFYIGNQPNLLRPANYPKSAPGLGYVITQIGNQKIMVVNLMTRLFMEPLDDPFAAMNVLLEKYILGQNVQAIFVDLHGEANSEKMAFAHYFDGRISAVIGTHTHVPTADHQILPKGTAYQTDAGMCGDYNSVIGMKKEAAIARFVTKIKMERLEPAEGEATLCACLIDIDGKTGIAKNIHPLRLGGQLSQCL